jgi:hypothetical protein
MQQRARQDADHTQAHDVGCILLSAVGGDLHADADEAGEDKYVCQGFEGLEQFRVYIRFSLIV